MVVRFPNMPPYNRLKQFSNVKNTYRDQLKLKTGKNVVRNRTRRFRQPHDKSLYLTTKFYSEFLGS